MRGRLYLLHRCLDAECDVESQAPHGSWPACPLLGRGVNVGVLFVLVKCTSSYEILLPKDK